ncbi:probable folate-biopterin transporter 8, chloroplastic isoform X2 [Tanacetum coccineum]
MAGVLLSDLGASITEVAKDALVAEYGQKNKIDGLQSYAFMALAASGGLFISGGIKPEIDSRLHLLKDGLCLDLNHNHSSLNNED